MKVPLDDVESRVLLRREDHESKYSVKCPSKEHTHHPESSFEILILKSQREKRALRKLHSRGSECGVVLKQRRYN